MHIHNSYLSRQSCIPLYGVSASFCAVTLKKAKKELSYKHFPYLAMTAAFSFLIMMFNIPGPEGILQTHRHHDRCSSDLYNSQTPGQNEKTNT